MGRLEAVSLYKGKQQAAVAHTGPSAASGAELGDGVTAGDRQYMGLGTAEHTSS